MAVRESRSCSQLPCSSLALFTSFPQPHGNAYPRCPANSNKGRSPGVRLSGKRAGRFSARILSWVLERMHSGLSSAVFWLNRFALMNVIRRPCAQYFPVGHRRARRNWLHGFLRLARCTSAVTEGDAPLPTETVDCISCCLGGRSVQLNVGDAETDLVFLWPVNGPMRQRGPEALGAEPCPPSR